MRDDREFEDFVAGSQPALRRTAYLLCGDWQLASDYVQEGLIRVYRRWPRLERDGRLHAYAKRAVVSAVLDARRRRSSTEYPRLPERGRTCHAKRFDDGVRQRGSELNPP